MGAEPAIARFLPGDVLTGVFAAGLLAVAVRMALTARNAKPREAANETLPEGPVQWALAGIIGLFSSLMGIGGGVLGVMALTHYGRTIHNAVATASGFGLAIGVPGAIGFMISGWGAEGLPPGSIGYVNVLAFAAIASMTVIAAPIGAAIAHRTSRGLLQSIFALYLIATSIKLFYDIWPGG